MTTTSTWQYECPNGHVSTRKTLDGSVHGSSKTTFYCDTCKNYHDSPHHAYLIDKKTGNRVYE